MQITCPSCSAEYEVPDDMLAGRAVKCARCGTQWDPVPAVVEAAFEPASLPAVKLSHETLAPETMAQESLSRDMLAAAPIVTWGAPELGAAPLHPPVLAPAVTASPVERPRALLAAWIASAVVILAIAGLAYFGREGIMQAWPPSQRLYAAFGLH